MRPLASLLLVGSLWLMIVLGCVSAPHRKVDTSRSTSSTSSPNPLPTIKRHKWEYTSYSDEMGRGQVYAMSIESSNTISLDSPYEGPQHSTLFIRSHPKHGNDVFITIERGQLLDSDFHSRISVRFDNDKALSFSSSRPDDLSSETLFLRNSFNLFVRRLRTAKTLKIEVPIYQAGNEVFEFDVEGFDWKKKQ